MKELLIKIIATSIIMTVVNAIVASYASFADYDSLLKIAIFFIAIALVVIIISALMLIWI